MTKQDNDFSDVIVQFLEVQALILVVIQLCQRNSGKMDEAGREVTSSYFIFQGPELIQIFRQYIATE